MSALNIRKGNIGKAIVRFLIGAIIIAAVVIVLNEVVLKKPANTLVETTPRPTTELTVNGGDDLTANDTELNGGADAVATEDGSDEGSTEPDGTNIGTEDAGTEAGDTGTVAPDPDDAGSENGEDGVFGEATPVVEETPEPTVTPDPTPTPEPTPTPLPASMYAQLDAAAKKSKWMLDKNTRVKNGITELEVFVSENGGSVISFTGWSYGNREGFNAKTSNTCYVYITNDKGDMQFYKTTQAPGATGIKHTLKNGHNMDYADFTCAIDLTNYPNGTYTMGSANHFKISGNTFHHGYTFGDAYTFTVVDGVLTSLGGIEN